MEKFTDPSELTDSIEETAEKRNPDAMSELEDRGDDYEDRKLLKTSYPWYYADEYWDEMEQEERTEMLGILGNRDYAYAYSDLFVKALHAIGLVWIGTLAYMAATRGLSFGTLAAFCLSLALPIAMRLRSFKIRTEEDGLEICGIFRKRRYRYSDFEMLVRRWGSVRLVLRKGPIVRFFSSPDFNFSLIREWYNLSWYLWKRIPDCGAVSEDAEPKRGWYAFRRYWWALGITVCCAWVATLVSWFLDRNGDLLFWLLIASLTLTALLPISIFIWRFSIFDGVDFLLRDEFNSQGIWTGALFSMICPILLNNLGWATMEWWPMTITYWAPVAWSVIWLSFIATAWRGNKIWDTIWAWMSVAIFCMAWFSGCLGYYNSKLDDSTPIIWFSAEIKKIDADCGCWKYEIRYEEIPSLETRYLKDTEQLRNVRYWDLVSIPVREWRFGMRWYDVDSAVLSK